MKFNDQPRQDYGIEVMYRVFFLFLDHGSLCFCTFMCVYIYIYLYLYGLDCFGNWATLKTDICFGWHDSLLGLTLLKGPPILGHFLIWDRLVSSKFLKFNEQKYVTKYFLLVDCFIVCCSLNDLGGFFTIQPTEYC